MKSQPGGAYNWVFNFGPPPQTQGRGVQRIFNHGTQGTASGRQRSFVPLIFSLNISGGYHFVIASPKWLSRYLWTRYQGKNADVQHSLCFYLEHSMTPIRGCEILSFFPWIFPTGNTLWLLLQNFSAIVSLLNVLRPSFCTLTTHSWLHWVDENDWWGSMTWKKSQKTLDTS